MIAEEVVPGAHYFITVDAMGFFKGDWFTGLKDNWLQHERTKQVIAANKNVLEYFEMVKDPMTVEEGVEAIKSIIPSKEEILAMLDKKHEEQVNKLNEMYIKTTHKVALEKVMEQLEVLKPYVTKENEEAIATALSKCFVAGTNFGKEFVTEMEKAILD